MTTANPPDEHPPRAYPVATKGLRHLHPDGSGGLAASSVTKDAWGPWALNLWTGRLEINGGAVYYITLSETRTAADLLDYVFQVTGKPWADDAVLGGLLRAVDDILHPQANLCPGGVPHAITRDQLASLITGAAHPVFAHLGACAVCDRPEGSPHKPGCSVITGTHAQDQPEGTYLP